MRSKADIELDIRSAERVVANLDGRLRTAKSIAADVVVRDLSASGFHVEVSSKISIGSSVELGLGGVGRVRATVVRPTANGYACSFERILRDDELAGALAGDNVVSVDFIGGRGLRLTVPEPDQNSMPAEDRWPGVARLSILVGSVVIGWSFLILVTKAVI